jgi:hypothetical protein
MRIDPKENPKMFHRAATVEPFSDALNPQRFFRCRIFQQLLLSIVC